MVKLFKNIGKIRIAVIAVILLFGALGLGTIYLLHHGSTDAWPETDCVVVGNKVVRTDVADSFRAIVMYKGEYQLRYVVRGQEYYVWADSGWSDTDRQLVQAKVDSRMADCDFRVRYNPNRPSECVVVHK